MDNQSSIHQRQKPVIYVIGLAYLGLPVASELHDRAANWISILPILLVN